VTDEPAEKPARATVLPADPNRALIEKLVLHLLNDLDDDDKRSPSLMECARKLLNDNSVTLASVRRGDFGKLAEKAAESFPFDDQGRPVVGPMVTN
jgi:hypothetical protein